MSDLAPNYDASTILAIDPGNTQSAWTLINRETRRPIDHRKAPNDEVLAALRTKLCLFEPMVVIEMVASYGMAVGAEVFDTCRWIGRFEQTCRDHSTHAELVFRQPIKLHHCHSPKAKDSNIVQALVDRFAYGQPNYGKGTKDAPGWFHGFKADVWQAYALAVYYADITRNLQTRNPVVAPPRAV